MFPWLDRHFEQWAVRRATESMHRHLGYLFKEHGAKLTDTFIGMGARMTIEFANIRLVYSNFRGDFRAEISPILPVCDLCEVDEVLAVLSGSGFQPNLGLQSLTDLGERLRPWTAALIERYEPKAYPAFRLAMNHWRQQ